MPAIHILPATATLRQADLLRLRKRELAYEWRAQQVAHVIQALVERVTPQYGWEVFSPHNGRDRNAIDPGEDGPE